MSRYLFLCLLILCFACQRPAPRQITPAFYYWKQTWTGNAHEMQYLRGLPARRLYVKMFDTDVDPGTGKPIPVAILREQVPLPDSIDIIPVVFIVNEVWTKPDTALAANINRLLEQLCYNIPTGRIPEVQMDCDWTRTSRDAYFAFLQQLREQSFFRHRQLSATIRMHQVKFLTNSGVPPVDKGLLMCYNMGDLRKAGDHNSILDENTMKSYIGNDRVSAYPVPLDIALPLFDWSVLFRDGRYAGILRNIGNTDLQDSALFAPSGKYVYTVRKDSVVNGYLLKAGNVVRRETSEPAVLEAVSRMVARQRQDYDPVVIFYHLDSVTLHNYPLDELQKIYRFFH
ncbi:hypothetical protein HHL17_29865 [Chitinophaga sp. G-6-1-13]|uniref:Uncharacterized protein n=1 Tax=Chitinophaga fulva TaxID=2728842 RepID=A0A848GTQ6_9BACT|nr:hypothetical protein [Chitinophaga fulva]NML41437.1 hypothetical protein [Chitinophaga fulva]